MAARNLIFHFAIIVCLGLFSATHLNAQYLTTFGKDIVDKDNNPILLRGVGLGGWMLQEPYMMKVAGGASNQKEFKTKIEDLIGADRTEEFYDAWLQNFVTKEDIETMANMGFNSVRLPMHYNLFTLPIEEETAGENTWLDKGFEMVDALLSWCKENELYLILDLHAAPGGQGYDEGISDYDPNFPSLWESEENKQKTIALWGKIAERYKNEEWIGGYDILNEPNWDLSGADIRDFYVKITNAIRVHDQNHIIFIEGNWFANDFTGLTPPWDSNMVYSFHKYWNVNTQSTIQWVLDMRNQYNVPLWMGESGENSNVWFKEAISLFESNNIGWAWWPWKRLDTTVSSYSIPSNSNYERVVNYFKGQVSRPDADLAYQGLMQLASEAHLKNNDYRKDVVDAMLRQPSSEELTPYSVNKIPGLILATHYDMGSQGLAYNDTEYGNYSGSNGTSSWNLGWVFRNDGVDISTNHSGTNDSNGFSVGYVNDREWIKYTVEVEQAGFYDIHTNYSAQSAGGKIQFEWNDTPISPLRGLGTTGSFSNFSSVTSNTAFLSEGTHVLKVRIVGDVEFNIESFDFSLSANQSPNFTHIGAVTEENDSQIRLTVNKSIVNSTLDPQYFTVVVNDNNVAVTNAMVENTNNRVILLDIDDTLSFYDEVTVSYTGGDVMSDMNESLGNFSNFPVQNIIQIVKLIPGKIEAEDYDTQNGIGIEDTSDVGLGANIKDLHIGDTATYKIDVQQSANYLFQYRIASERPSSSFRLSFRQGDAVVYQQTYSLNGTNGWQSWQTLEEEIYLEHGKYTMVLTVLGDEFNLNWMNFELIDDSNRLGIPGKIEAEDYDTQNGLVVSGTSDTGGGQQLGYLNDGDYAKYRVRVENEGTYTVKSRVATDYDDAVFSLELEKSDGAVYNVGFVSPESTGGWDTWETVAQTTTLPQGNYMLKMTSLQSATNINWYDFEHVSSELQYTSIPSKIEAENYHVHYGIQIEECFDVDGGRNLSFIDAGDYVKYLISVPQPGYYTMKLRTAGFESGKIQASLSSQDAADQWIHTFDTAETGGWQNWETVEADVLIMSGDYTLTLNIIEGEFNFNWIEFVYNEGGGFQVPGKIEAEDYWKQSGLETENCTDIGGGANLSYMDTGDYAKYLIHVNTSNSYIIKARVASNGGGGEFQLKLKGSDDVDLTINDFQIDNTGGWQSWQTIEKEMDIPAGTYELTMNVTKSLFNLNWIAFELVEEVQPDDEIERVSLYPNPTSDRLTIESDVSFQHIEVYSMNGRLVQQIQIPETQNYTINTPFSSGIYFIRIKNFVGAVISTNKFVVNK